MSDEKLDKSQSPLLEELKVRIGEQESYERMWEAKFAALDRALKRGPPTESVKEELTPKQRRSLAMEKVTAVYEACRIEVDDAVYGELAKRPVEQLEDWLAKIDKERERAGEYAERRRQLMVGLANRLAKEITDETFTYSDYLLYGPRGLQENIRKARVRQKKK